ncbi:hypothetical protein CCACVL1_12754 [Corchorus capsularis]|uniref:Uncharacterized protein n=1 Tax=Corchorus capsularis TaxID=210143 RepID=A0A1R3IDU8_COCAP|nr:hypothetical protein CCACVL1_12754 [Corchorus capsularis]
MAAQPLPPPSAAGLRGGGELCCTAFSSAFETGDGYCFGYILRQPLIFGFPLNQSRVASLSSF